MNTLRRLSRTRNFENITPDQLLRDRIVCGLRSQTLRQQLLRQKNLTLKECVEACQTVDTSQSIAMKITTKDNLEDRKALTAVKQELEDTNHMRRAGKGQRFANAVTNKTKPLRRACGYCGNRHLPGAVNCPAYGETCRTCKTNHFSEECRQRIVQELAQAWAPHRTSASHGESRMHFIGESDIEEETETNENAYGVELVNSDNQNRNKRWLVNLDLKAKTERSSVSTCCQLDSGSTCNVMTDGCYKRIAIGTPMDKTDVKLRFYDGSMKPALGQCKLKCFHNNEEFTLIFQIIE